MSESIEKAPIKVLEEVMSGIDAFNPDYRYELGKIQDAAKYAAEMTTAIFSFNEIESIKKIPDIAKCLDSAVSTATSYDDIVMNASTSIELAGALPEVGFLRSVVEGVVKNTIFRIITERIDKRESWTETMSRPARVMREVMHDEERANTLEDISKILNEFIETTVDKKRKSELLAEKAELVGRLPRDYGFRDKIALFTSIPEELGAVKEAVKLSGGSVSGI